jgi:hypothetical protein
MEGPQPAPVSLWPIAQLRHHESDESGGEEDGSRRTTRVASTQGVTAPSGPVMAPPSIAPPVVATVVPTIPAGTTAAPSTIPTPTVAPTPVATAPSTVPTTQPAAGGVSTTTTTGAQLPGERPSTTEERHPKRAATEAAATLQTLGPRGPAATAVEGGNRRVAGGPAVGASPGRGPTAVGDGPATPRGSPNKNHLHGLQRGCQNGTGRSGSSQCSVTAGQAGAYGGHGRSPTDGVATPRGSGDDRALRAAEGRLSGPDAALAQEILRRGAAAMAVEAASAGQGAQRPEEKTGARASPGATRPGTMPPPPTPTHTTGPSATTTGPQVWEGRRGPLCQQRQ